MARRRLLPGADARQGLVALALNSSTSLVAGAVLGSLTATFERRPGLLVLVPAAIGLRGNVFGSLGNRVSTSIHAGELQLRLRRTTVLGQNVLAAGALTLGHVADPRGGRRRWCRSASASATRSASPTWRSCRWAAARSASLPVLAATLGLAAGAVRYGWDLDNVTAPLVSTLGDVLTLPALYLATGLLGLGLVTSSLGWVLAGAAVVGAGGRRPLRRSRSSSASCARRSRCSLFAGLVSSLAGVALERRLDTFAALPALLILVPAHLSSSGALGGILSGRLSSQLLLGLAPADGGAVARGSARPRVRRRARACRCSSSTAPARTSCPRCSARSRPGLGRAGRRVAARRPARDGRRRSRSPTTAPSPPSASASTPTPTASRWSAAPSTSSAPSPWSSPSPPGLLRARRRRTLRSAPGSGGLDAVRGRGRCRRVG